MDQEVKLGLRSNWKQFSLLVLLNGFVGAMVGLERTILPQLAEQEFNVASTTAILSFIAVFGVSKSLTNYFTGSFANQVGRRNLLILGWVLGLPVPIILIFASHWYWVVIANVFLGMNQGLTWSTTVLMKIDLVGEKNRGLAMGLNESAGYIAVGLLAFLTGWLATEFGLRPYPFFLGIGIVMVGLFFSIFLIRDTHSHVQLESKTSKVRKLNNIFLETTWKDRNLGSITQAGMINNLNDGMIWGLLPVLLIAQNFNLTEAGKITALYPIVWGLGQLGTGKIADMVHRKSMLFYGMLLQAVAIIGLAYASSFFSFAGLAIILGIGTAMVYPTFLASIADHTHPDQRASSIGVFRFWRDMGYTIGALMTGIIVDLTAPEYAVLTIGGLTFISSLIIKFRMEN